MDKRNSLFIPHHLNIKGIKYVRDDECFKSSEKDLKKIVVKINGKF